MPEISDIFAKKAGLVSTPKFQSQRRSTNERDILMKLAVNGRTDCPQERQTKVVSVVLTIPRGSSVEHCKPISCPMDLKFPVPWETGHISGVPWSCSPWSYPSDPIFSSTTRPRPFKSKDLSLLLWVDQDLGSERRKSEKTSGACNLFWTWGVLLV